MKQPKITVPLAGLLGVAACAGSAGVAGAAEVKRPNIIFVLADDLGYGDLGCYGGEGTQTKNIDRLAREGIRFTQFYVNSPICSPSRVALTTGQYPARWNITSFIDNRAANRRRGMAQWLDLSAPTLARSLSQAGYLTGHFGKWHMGGGRDVGEAPLPTQYGFDESLTQFEGLGDRVLPILSGDGGPPKRMALGIGSEKLGRGAVTWEARSKITGTFVSRALGFIHKADQAGKPFYLNLWPDDVHSPFDPPRDGRGDGSKRALYRGVLNSMDAQLGPLFEAIRGNPRLRSNTLIVFASDNGPEAGAGSAGPFRDGKGTLYEGGIREPFIVWGPGLLPAARSGTVNGSAVVSGVDLVPSLLSIARAHQALPAAQSDGIDLSATLLGQKTAGRTSPLFWKRPPDRSGPKRAPLPDLAVREGNWKLLIQEDGSRAQLFDLSQDAGEIRNLASSQPQMASRLKQAVLKWNQSLPPSNAANPKIAEQFTLKSGDHLDQAQSPAIAGRGFRIEVKFDAKSARGVLVAQGGVANGYALFVDENGRLNFLVRVEKQATSIATARMGAGVHSAVAHLGRDGALSLSLDSQIVARGQAPAIFSQTPLDGLNIGSDQGGLVGSYPQNNAFGGTIEAVSIQLDPLTD